MFGWIRLTDRVRNERLQRPKAVLPLTVALAACALLSTRCDGGNKMEQALVGDWEAVATQLVINTEGRTQQSRSIDVSEGEWESKANRTPPQMTYFQDHRYHSQYISLIDQTGRQVTDTIKQDGTWQLHGDTLLIHEPNLSVPDSWFTLKIEGEILELTAMMDIDNDGDQDDKYWMRQRRR